jgi:hypothetical protein
MFPLFYLFHISSFFFSFIEASLKPFSHYCFLNETANIINVNCTENKQFVYVMNVITYDAPAEVFLGLKSPYNAICKRGRCNSSFIPGYDYKVSKSCINETMSYIETSKALNSIIIKSPAHSNEEYFISLKKKPYNTECSFQLTKGTYYSEKQGLCTTPKLIDKSNYTICEKAKPEVNYDLRFILLVSSCGLLVIIICILIGLIRKKRMKRRESLDAMYSELKSVRKEISTQTFTNKTYSKFGKKEKVGKADDKNDSGGDGNGEDGGDEILGNIIIDDKQ